MSKKIQQIIRLERDTTDYILPKDFFQILVHRFFPVISLTYVISILGIAISRGDFFHAMFLDNTAYVRGIMVVVWISVPSIIWILLRGNPLLSHMADLWYKILAGLMILTIMLSFFLFPEAKMYGMRMYFALSVPLFLMVYILMIREKLPPVLSYPLNAMGVCALIWGAAMRVVF